MFKKISIILLLFVLLPLAGCSGNNTLNTMSIEINTITSSLGAVGANTNDFETQSFKYTMTLTNNDASDIKIVSVEPVLSEEFIEKHINNINCGIISKYQLGISDTLVASRIDTMVSSGKFEVVTVDDDMSCYHRHLRKCVK